MRRPRAKMRGFENGTHIMDSERINQIGNSLADLSSRTEALRRYL